MYTCSSLAPTSPVPLASPVPPDILIIVLKPWYVLFFLSEKVNFSSGVMFKKPPFSFPIFQIS